MNRRSLILLSSSLLITILIVTIASSYVLGADNPQVDQGHGKHLVIADGIAVTVPTDEDYDLATKLRSQSEQADNGAVTNRNSDPLLPEQKAKKLSKQNNTLEVITSEEVAIAYEHNFAGDGRVKRQLLAQLITTTNEVLLIEDRTTATPQLIRSPRKDKYLFSEDQAIWVVDIDSLQSKKVTSDEVKGMNRAAILKQLENKDNAYLVWASQPSWSKDGQKIAYMTNRGTPGATGGAVWVVDLATGIEQQVYAPSNWLGIFGWTSTGEIVIWEGKKGTVKVINLEGRIIHAPVTGVQNVQLDPTGTRLVYSPTAAPTEYWVYDMSARTKKKILSVTAGIQFDPNVQFSSTGNKLVALEYNKDATRTIRAYNFKINTSLTHQIPGMMVTAVPQWMNESTLLFNAVARQDTTRSFLLNIESQGENP